MHKLLLRQIDKALGSISPPRDEAAWREFLRRIDEAYEQADSDRRFLERSLELTSDELLQRNAALRTDVAARRASEEEARRMASLLAATLESTGDGILAIGGTSEITAMNDRFAQIWRLPPALRGAREGREISEAVLAQVSDAEGFVARMKEILDQPLVESADMIEFRDGRIIERDSRPQILNGGIVGRVWCFRDVTGRTRAEQDLRRSEAWARSLIENISDVITITDVDGAYKFVSASVAGVLGYSPSDLIGKRVMDFVHPDDAAQIAASIARHAATGEATRTEFRYRHKDGSWRVLESLRVDARKEPGIEGFLGVARDVTEKRRLESEARSHREAAWRQERLSALGTLVAGVAHEINNPLTYIIGNLELAQFALADLPEGPAVDDLRRQIQTAIEGSNRIARISRSLKTISRHETPGAYQRIALGEIVRDVMALAAVLTPDHVDFAIEGTEADAYVMGDPAQLLQVVLNLVKNAIEAVGARTGKVTLGVRRDETHAYIRVVDDGPGIDPSMQPRLFTPFFTTKPQGTGLGLSIVHTIVKSHGGDILLESSLGRGSTFTVTLPLAPGHASA